MSTCCSGWAGSRAPRAYWAIGATLGSTGPRPHRRGRSPRPRPRPRAPSRLQGRVEGDGGADEIPHGGLVDRVRHPEVDGPRRLGVEAGVEEPPGVVQAAPWKKLSFAWSLNVPALHTMPSCAHAAVPHFHSSRMSGSALWITSRSWASISPRQSPSEAILRVISRAGSRPDALSGLVMVPPSS